jgi:hypothetical protein
VNDIIALTPLVLLDCHAWLGWTEAVGQIVVGHIVVEHIVVGQSLVGQSAVGLRM